MHVTLIDETVKRLDLVDGDGRLEEWLEKEH